MNESSEKLKLIQDDPWLKPYESEIRARRTRVEERLHSIEKEFGSLYDFSGSHLYLGIHFVPDRQGWIYREWAPQADALHLKGDFNGWDSHSHPLVRNDKGIWELFLPYEEYRDTFKHKSLVKVVVSKDGLSRDRLPAYIRRTVQDSETKDFSAQIWMPESQYEWKYSYSGLKETPLIYECHVGMSQEKEEVASYIEFADNVLPRIAELGYNCIQLMAIQEHPYYGSFGYHVSNFYSPSSRFGTPEELKYLIDKAHSLGLACLLDIVHSHAVKNIAEGLNDFDGSGSQYFYEGSRGYHDAWDSKLFDYSKTEVTQFLLSNVRYWLEEFHFDGFRFDGITSMLYHHHGLYIDFDHYDKYFVDQIDWDAIIYVQLANTLIKTINAKAVSIAEDMSGMPGGCQPIQDGGLGFDFRLAMGIPDYWIKLLKHKKDEDWNVQDMWQTLSNRRYNESTISYVESHDQAMVGDKTVAFWLMDKEMYTSMSKSVDSLKVDRGLAIHKMLRLFTSVVGGEGYLNFMGNEFGHPEWIDFPRQGNDWSHKYARRQWSLVDQKDLKYHYLNDFDRAMIELVKDFSVLSSPPAQLLNMDVENQVVICERKGLIFIFNFSPTESIADYSFFVPRSGNYQVVLCSDDARFGGFDRINTDMLYPTTQDENGTVLLRFYVTNRTCVVLQHHS